ncbi:MAG: DUF4263 domain-containing protein [Paeniclostridium sordellii]|nr:DUF4263 domain-containing protein [Paeniclostridium sordellii]
MNRIDLNVKQILDTKKSDEIYKIIIELSKSDKEEDIELLKDFLRIKDKCTYDKHIIPHLACLALVNKGEKGINELKNILDEIDGIIYPNKILSTLLNVSEGFFPEEYLHNFNEFEKEIAINENMKILSRQKLLDFVLESKIDYDKFDKLINFIHLESFSAFKSKEKTDLFRKNIFNMISQSSINISYKLINELRILINNKCREEEYQVFLKNNPVFLNPLANKVIDKKKLGDDYITDFIIHLINEEYIVVEIEKPHDNIFTANNEFTSKFTHAFGQVLDFIDWVDSNNTYAQSKLNGIKSPRGLLIMGRREGLTDKQKMKLKKFNENSSRIEVLTYDDLIKIGENLLKNIMQEEI